MNMKKQAASMIRSLGRRLVVASSVRTNPASVPLGMLDVERITMVAQPIATLLTRPATVKRW